MMKSNILKDFIRESFTPPTKWKHNENKTVTIHDNKRIVFFDLAKGICIILVVLIHIDNHTNNSLYNIPNFSALRMPLYFVLSGIFFKAYETKIFFIKKINNIVVPLIFWLAISDLMRMCYSHFSVDLAIVKFIKDPLCRYIDCNPVLWFLICLFITNIVFYYIHSICKNNKQICLSILFLALIGYLLFKYYIKLPLWIDSALIALPFFFLGYCCKDMTYLKPEYSNKKSLLIGVTFIVLSYAIYYTFNQSTMIISANFFQGSPIAAYLNGIFIVLGVLLLCKVINWLPIVSYFGRYSIIVLCVHKPLLTLRFVKVWFGHEITIWEFTAIILIACWLAIPICKKVLPYFVAQKPLFKVELMKVNK